MNVWPTSGSEPGPSFGPGPEDPRDGSATARRAGSLSCVGDRSQEQGGRAVVSRSGDRPLPRYQLRFLRDDAVVREDTFRAADETAALKAALLRLGVARPGETLVVLQGGIETGRVGPRGEN